MKLKRLLTPNPYSPNVIAAHRENEPKIYSFVSAKHTKTRYCEHCSTRKHFNPLEKHQKGWKCSDCREER
jgi:hypothetical protein